jgi:hypothetical protein
MLRGTDPEVSVIFHTPLTQVIPVPARPVIPLVPSSCAPPLGSIRNKAEPPLVLSRKRNTPELAAVPVKVVAVLNVATLVMVCPV